LSDACWGSEPGPEQADRPGRLCRASMMGLSQTLIVERGWRRGDLTALDIGHDGRRDVKDSGLVVSAGFRMTEAR
jgi:hypothetical protein